ncbi:uncharacterized protein [Elaeis guineensis]|uniref:uncharacterized protein n=1 Tax=Elaeis guineensis var. tenera TaxID=51953 RepID=UPI003C6D0FF8
MRKFTDGKEIIRPAPTRFATNFIALQSILGHKYALRAMVTSKEWTTSAYAKDSKGKKLTDDVLNSLFWNECATIVKLIEPLIRVLRIVDSDDRPSMGYLYHAMHQARDEMIKRFRRRKIVVEPYLRIVDSRWDLQLHQNLHAAGFWLNPCFQYDLELMDKYPRSVSGLLDVIERYSFGNPTLQGNLTNEMRLFRNTENDFGCSSAINDRSRLALDEWWVTYGSCAHNLQKLAIRVLSQTCNASGCERNWSIFEHIHSKKRNRLEHQRLNDLVFVHYNLRLQQRFYFKGRNYDPIDFELFGDNDAWILVDEPSELTSEELKTFHHELASCSIQENNNNDILNLEDLDGDDGENDGNDANRREDGGDENIATQEDVFANIDINFSSLA